ncbi:MAG: hypothetical protein V8S54_02855 [Lachnospiraceae bacterium]
MYKQKHTEVNMLDGPIFSTMVRFAIPVLFSSIFQQLYNTMDTVIVGHTLLGRLHWRQLGRRHRPMIC